MWWTGRGACRDDHLGDASSYSSHPLILLIICTWSCTLHLCIFTCRIQCFLCALWYSRITVDNSHNENSKYQTDWCYFCSTSPIMSLCCEVIFCCFCCVSYPAILAHYFITRNCLPLPCILLFFTVVFRYVLSHGRLSSTSRVLKVNFNVLSFVFFHVAFPPSLRCIAFT